MKWKKNQFGGRKVEGQAIVLHWAQKVAGRVVGSAANAIAGDFLR